MENVTTCGSSVASTTTLKADAERWQSSPASEKERAARSALEARTGRTFSDLECARAHSRSLEARTGRTFSDLEWARARARMLDFVSILRAWHREGTTTASELPKAA